MGAGWGGWGAKPVISPDRWPISRAVDIAAARLLWGWGVGDPFCTHIQHNMILGVIIRDLCGWDTETRNFTRAVPISRGPVNSAGASGGTH